MIAPSYPFLGFALLVALLIRVIPFDGIRRYLILAANITFLASFWGNTASYFPFGIFVLAGYLSVTALQARRFVTLRTTIALIVLSFCWIKRYAFIPESLLISGPYITVGLSYIFFRILSLTINVGQGVLIERISVTDYLNYTLDFNSLTAGPIQTYEDYQSSRFEPSILAYCQAAERIIQGLFKVLIMSELMNVALHGVTADVHRDYDVWYASLQGALLIAIYPVYLYFNFSGYTDFVVGCASLIGIRLPENFDRPFSSKNFIEFWSRWHISLSSWLKTYVYNPLLTAMFRRIERPSLQPFLAVGAFFATFFLVGAWHGQNSEFLFFGVLQGGGVAVNKLYQILAARVLGRNGYKTLAANPLYSALCRGLTFTWFGFSLLWFWSSWTQLAQFVDHLGAAAIIAGVVLVVLVATGFLQFGEWARSIVLAVRYDGVAIVASKYFRIAVFTAAVAILVFSNVILNASAPDIVYKTF